MSSDWEERGKAILLAVSELTVRGEQFTAESLAVQLGVPAEEVIAVLEALEELKLAEREPTLDRAAIVVTLVAHDVADIPTDGVIRAEVSIGWDDELDEGVQGIQRCVRCDAAGCEACDSTGWIKWEWRPDVETVPKAEAIAPA